MSSPGRQTNLKEVQRKRGCNAMKKRSESLKSMQAPRTGGGLGRCSKVGPQKGNNMFTKR